MLFTSKLAKNIVPLLIIFILLAACGGNQTAEPYVFKFEETEAPTAQVIVTESVPTPTEEQALPEPAPVTDSSIDEIISNLEGIPIEEFFDASYTQLLLRNPELLTELNLSAQFGLRNDQLNNLSDAYLRDTQRLEAAYPGPAADLRPPKPDSRSADCPMISTCTPWRTRCRDMNSCTTITP